MEAGQDAGAPMFAIFVISLMSLFLVPYTIYKLCNLASGEAAKPWETVSHLYKSCCLLDRHKEVRMKL